MSDPMLKAPNLKVALSLQPEQVALSCISEAV